MFKATIKVKSSPEFAGAVKQALEPEKDFKTDRARYAFKQKKGELEISVEAEDATAFRAVMSSITGMISVVESAMKLAKK